MLQISTWSRLVTLLILLAGLLIALPNALPDNVLARLPSCLPKNTVSLGLDLQGGSYLLLEVELDQVQKDELELLGDRSASVCARPHIGLHQSADSADTRIGAHHRSAALRRRADDRERVSIPPPAAACCRSARVAYDMTAPATDTHRHEDDGRLQDRRSNDIVAQSIEVVRSASTSSARASRRSNARATTASSCRCRASPIRRA